MERYVWKGQIRPEDIETYRARHDAIWPTMVQALKKAGIQNYSIWLNSDGSLVGYYECPCVETAKKMQAEDPVVQEWEAFMADILTFRSDLGDPVEVFYLDDHASS